MELPKAATPTRDLPADRPPWHRVQSAAGPSLLEGRAIAGLAAGQPAPDRPLRAPRRPPHRIPAPGLRADLRPQAATVVKPPPLIGGLLITAVGRGRSAFRL